MGVDQLVKEIGKVRGAGIAGANLDALPALREALVIHWPDLGEPDRQHLLEDLLAEAAALLPEHDAEGIRIALGIGDRAYDPVDGHLLTKAERREAFGLHIGKAARTVRAKYEQPAFAKLATAIARLPASSAGAGRARSAPSSAPSSRAIGEALASPLTGAPTSDKPVDALRDVMRDADQRVREAEQRGHWEKAAIWSVAALAVMRLPADDSQGDHEFELANRYFDTGKRFLFAGRVDAPQEQILNAQQIGQTLLDLEPTNTAYRVFIGAVLTLRGTLHLQAGRPRDAEDVLARAVAHVERLASEDSDDAEYGALLASTLTMLGMLYSSTDREAEAEAALTRAVAHLKRLADEDPDDAGYRALLASPLTMLGMYYTSTDRETEAEDALVRAVAILQPLVDGTADEQPDRRLLMSAHLPLVSAPLLLAEALVGLGGVYWATDRDQDAEDALVRAVALLDDLADEVPPTTPVPKPLQVSARTLLALALYLLGVLYQALGRIDDAENALTRAVSRLRAADDPDDGETLDTLAEALESLAEIYQQTDRHVSAEDARDGAHAIRRRLADRKPDDPAPR